MLIALMILVPATALGLVLGMDRVEDLLLRPSAPAEPVDVPAELAGTGAR